jgi:Insertion element 4 transposase N-terminal
VVDGNPGDGHGRADRLTDRIGLGVLTRLVHRDLVDEVLAETDRTERRRRLLPARVVVYFVLAMTLFFDDAYEEVMRKLVEGLRFFRSWDEHWQVPPRRCARPAPAWVPSQSANSTHGWPGRWPGRAPPVPGWGICG